jgi:ribosome biogenesis GTPase
MSVQRARVIQSTGKWYKVMPEETNDDISFNERLISCQLPGKFRLKKLQQTNPVAVGDFVHFRQLDDGSGLIEEIEDRFNKISRKATHGRKGEHILAANIDRGFVVQSIHQPDFKTGFIDRFLVTAEAFGVQPVIILNKMDLGTEEDAPEVAQIMDLYTGLGYPIMLSSIYDEESIIDLAAAMQDKTSVFIGPSGCGKTSLLNEIQPGLNRSVGAVSESSNKGKHTTTFAELLPLHFGGYLADTPGIREFGLIHFELNEIDNYFPEMAELKDDCKFHNCSHLHEPECAVMDAFKKGEIAASRYHSYINIYESLESEEFSAGSRKR